MPAQNTKDSTVRAWWVGVVLIASFLVVATGLTLGILIAVLLH
jgi:hypothetical protein